MNILKKNQSFFGGYHVYMLATRGTWPHLGSAKNIIEILAFNTGLFEAISYR